MSLIKPSPDRAGSPCQCRCHPHVDMVDHPAPGCCRCCPLMERCGDPEPHEPHYTVTRARSAVFSLCEGRRRASLRVRVDGAHEVPSTIEAPRLSAREPDRLPGPIEYRIDLTAVITSSEEFETWRKLLGKTLEVKG